MLRAILGVIVGYLAMAILLFCVFTGAYLAMGADRAFEPGTYNASMTWIVMSFVVGLIAAILGGLICALIARPGSKAPKVLAGIALVLGLALAIPVFMDSSTDSGPRTGDVPNMEAMLNAKQPPWVAAVNPFIGAVGILIGGSLRKPKQQMA